MYVNNVYYVGNINMKVSLILKYMLFNSSLWVPFDQPPLSGVSNSFTLDIPTDTRFIEKDVGDIEVTYENVRSLAAMSYNVYFDTDTRWIDVNLNKTVDMSMTNDSVRAYLFSNEDMTINVLVFKGTSIYWETKQKGGTDTVANDKFNDNLFFSCCFYKQSNIFTQDHCKCLKGTCKTQLDKQECQRLCYKNSTTFENNYLNVANNITQYALSFLKKTAENPIVLFAGHSLGGAIATMMGILHEKQVVTFESPGEKRYVDLIGLQYNQKQTERMYHFGHNADIIFTGKCKGYMSWCYLGGYFIETKCHIGLVCEYDTINQLGLRESIFTHKIQYVLDNVISKWNGTLPTCKYTSECEDCTKWNVVEP